jgi:acyl-CoA thioesterase-2
MTANDDDAQLWSFLRPLMDDDGAFCAVAAENTAPNGHPFGGFLLALAAWAASLHAPGRFPHALHGFFIRPVRAGGVLHGQVSIVRDGREFSQRHVCLSQDGRLVFTAMLSLHAPPGLAASPPRPDGQELLDADSPDACTATPVPFSTRAVTPFLDVRTARAAPLRLWARPRGRLPDSRAAHYALLAAMTDLGPARIPLPDSAAGDGAYRQTSGVTLAHSVWFHGRPRPGEWVLLSLDGVPSDSGRSLAVGTALWQDGSRCATYIQEVLAQHSKA